MVIVNVTNQLKKELRESNFSPLFLENCLNSKFLSIEKNEKKIVGACFVGGTFNSNGIEIIKEFQGMGLGKKLLDEIISECQKRKISFLMGVFKPTNIISIKTHMKIGYRLLFTIFYNHQEGKEIVVILPFNSKGEFLAKFLKFFNTRIGNLIFTILFRLSQPFIKGLIAFDSRNMPQFDFDYAVSHFEKVSQTLSNMDNST
jgi:GNAT superfamily N-acetyltransferase